MGRASARGAVVGVGPVTDRDVATSSPARLGAIELRNQLRNDESLEAFLRVLTLKFFREDDFSEHSRLGYL